MKLQLIIAALTTGLLIAQDERKPEQPPQRRPGDSELPFPPPRQQRGDADQPRQQRGDGDRGRQPDPERRGNPGDPGSLPPLNRISMKMQPYIGLVTRTTGPELAAQLNQPEGFGLVVDAVLEDSPAKTAGLDRNDVVQKLDDQWLVNPPQLEALIRRAGKGGEVSLTILRGGAEKKISLKVGEKMMPERRAVRIFDPTQGELRESRDGFNFRDPQPRRFDLRADEPQTDPRPVRDGGRAMRSDDSGHYEITSVRGRRIFTMKKPDGSVVWTGSVGTPEERAAMPEDARKKLEELEQSRPVPRPVPTPRRDGEPQAPRPRDPDLGR